MPQETMSGTESYTLALKAGTVLHGQYEIAHVLGKPGGFAITYLAVDLNLDTPVAIKEFLPRDLAGRGPDRTSVLPHSSGDGELFEYGLRQFVQEARTLARLNHPNVVRVRAFFEAHATAYLVMDYLPGRTLAEVLDAEGGRLPPETAVGLLLPVLDGLSAAHEQQVWHRDIKPENIYITEGGQPILLDFGAARQAVEGRSRSMTAIVSGGFAPIEQYTRKGQQGPWTDVYGCAAVLYRAVTGIVPLEATERVYEDDPIEAPETLVELPTAVSRAIMRGLTVNRKERPQSAAEFAGMLRDAMGLAVPVPHIFPGRAPQEPAREVRRPLVESRVAPPPPRPEPAAAGAGAPSPAPGAASSRPVRIVPRRSNARGVAATAAVFVLAAAFGLWRFTRGPISDPAVVAQPIAAVPAAAQPKVSHPEPHLPPPAQPAVHPPRRAEPRVVTRERREPAPAKHVTEPGAAELAAVTSALDQAQAGVDQGSYGGAAGSLRSARSTLSNLRGVFGERPSITRLRGRLDALESRNRRACAAEAISAVERNETPPDCHF